MSAWPCLMSGVVGGLVAAAVLIAVLYWIAWAVDLVDRAIGLPMGEPESPERMVILMLGGSFGRVDTAVLYAGQLPWSYVIFSSQREPAAIVQRLQAAQIERHRVWLSYDAWDTVSNFTTTYRAVRRERVTRLLIVTSRAHMDRAMAIARVIYAGTGVQLVAVPVDDATAAQSSWMTRVDLARTHAWRHTGWVPTVPWLKARALASYADERRTRDALLARWGQPA